MSAQGETWQTSSNRKQDTRTRLAWLPCVMTSLRPATLPGHPWQTKTDLRRMFRRRSGTRVLAPPSKYAFSVCTTALSSPSTTFSVSCISHSYPLLLAMSTSLKTTNKPGNPSDDLPIRTGDGQEHDSSDGGGIPPAEAAQGDNPSQVWVIIFTYRAEVYDKELYRSRWGEQTSNRSDQLGKPPRLSR